MDLSLGSLLASLLVGSVGFGIFLFGKKQVRGPQLVVGMALMVLPYCVTGAAWIGGLGAALVLALVAALRLGL